MRVVRVEPVGCAAASVVVWHGLRLYLGFEPMPIAEKD